MPRIPLVGATYTLRTIRADLQRTVNWFPEAIESGNGNNGEKFRLVQVPGLLKKLTIGAGPIRGLYTTSKDGVLAAVSGDKLYAVDSNWAATKVGDLQTSTGAVDMADNNYQLMLVDGNHGYVANLLDGSFTEINSDGFQGGTRVCFLDGYFVVNDPDSGQFRVSNLQDGLAWDALDYNNAYGLPDDTVAVLNNQRQIWVLGERSVEVYWNSGDTFPLSKVDGAFIEFGCGAALTAQKMSGSVVWLSDNGQVLVATGYTPKRVSNFAVEQAIQDAGDYSAAEAFVYNMDGHIFYCLQIPGCSTTWCYDITTDQWHERAELVNGAFAKSRVTKYAHAYGKHVVAGGDSGEIYVYDNDTYTNDGDVLVRERTIPHLSYDLKRLAIPAFQLDIDGGRGLTTGQGSDPQVMLQVSRDGGWTWGNENWVTLGAIGAYRSRAIWRQLGQARDWVFRLRVTDPIKADMLGATVIGLPGIS